MMDGRENGRFLALLAVVLFVGAILTVLLSPPAEKETLNSDSTAQNGALALRLWLTRSGHTVQDNLIIPIDLDRAEVLFLLEPPIPYSSASARELRDWVERGNTLVVAGNSFSIGTVLDAFDVAIEALPVVSDQIAAGAPTLLHPPLSGRLKMMSSYGLSSARPDVVPHLFRGATVVLLSFAHGNGMVWIAGMSEPFSNIGLGEEENARLVANILASFPPSASIAFDDGLVALANDNAVNDWLFGTVPGVGLLIGGAILFIFFAAQGRRFGRAIPIPEDKLRREPVEYIYAIASLFRRANGRDDILRHIQNRFRRQLSRRYGVDPRLSDAEYIGMLIYRDPSLDENALRDLLKQLAQHNVSESVLLQLSHDVDAWLRKLQ